MKDCVKALERIKYRDESVSESEWEYARMLSELCEDFFVMFENYGTEYEVDIVK